MKKFWLIGRMNVFLFTCFLALQFVSALAQPGSLDPTFGNGGKVTDWSGWASGVAIQPDAKVVLVGGTGEFNVLAVARYNPDGSADTAFGNAGKVTVPILFNFYVFGIDVAIQPGGKIVVASCDADQGYGAIVRLNVDGSLDTSFGTNGTVHTTGGEYSIAIQPDGKIITSAGAPFNNPSEYGIRRYNANGSVDTTFGIGGVADVALAATAVVLQTDGKIVAAGEASNSFAVARLNSNGTADTSFGYGGVVTTSIGVGFSSAQAVSIEGDGKIVAAGTTFNANTYTNYSLVRYNPNGSLDTTFDNDGIVALAPELSNWIGWSYRHVVALMDGRIVVSGTRFDGLNYDFAIGRYNSDGSLDTTFGGGDGVTTVDFNNSNDRANALAVDRQGRAVVVGGSDGFFALARFLLQPPPFDFDGDGRSDVSVFRPMDRTWYLNQSTNGFDATQFGLSTDKIVPADYDGDGKTDIAVYRDGAWWIRKSGNGTVETRAFGLIGDIPVPADYTGDGRDELAVYRNGQWWALDLSNDQSSLVNFGLASDKPVPSDYDGDGRFDQAVYRDGIWHLNRSTQGYTVIHFGLPSDKPVVGDYDGDGKADPAVYRDGTWYLWQSTAGFAAFNWGLATDIPAPADYDGDGKADASVYRDGTWYLLRTTGGISIQQFGLTNDQPIPSAYLP